MIARRYRVVGVGIGFLVLGVVLGLIIGSSTAPGRMVTAVSDLAADRGEDVTRLQAERDQLAAGERAADGFAAGIAPVALRGSLQGSAVTIVSVGGAPADADAIGQMVGQAGGTMAGRVQLTDAVTDPARADQLRDLATRLLPAGAQLPTSPDPGTVAGGLLGSALLTMPNVPPPAADQTQSVLAGLAGAGFAEQGPAPGPAQLVVVLTGTPAEGVDAQSRSSTAARLAAELDRRGSGGVLAGPTATGAVGAVRADPALAGGLSTVDDVGAGAGRVATVLALREQLTGRAGAYGSGDGATAPLPAAQP
ncbi:copper transporter [Pseudonocardia endophytica]|uniref:Copper transport outer membrane protein MctB n=1 Tax=Pseudonocardia endophytica TaxID=401976 RepID=A0A4R1I3U8_PSEEN|nr:copper transporter [Pseudonocardia endophytica]TCK24682.1 copper transport outer membrane protein MctB [Pseudonocardia endophytica]